MTSPLFHHFASRPAHGSARPTMSPMRLPCMIGRALSACPRTRCSNMRVDRTAHLSYRFFFLSFIVCRPSATSRLLSRPFFAFYSAPSSQFECKPFFTLRNHHAAIEYRSSRRSRWRRLLEPRREQTCIFGIWHEATTMGPSPEEYS